MRGLGVSSHYTKSIIPKVIEILGNKGQYNIEQTISDGLIIHTDRIDDDKTTQIDTILEDYKNVKIKKFNHALEINWHDIKRFAECKTADEVRALCPDGDGGNLITSDGCWCYCLPKLSVPAQILTSFPTFRSKLKSVYTEGRVFEKFGGYWVSHYYSFAACPHLESVIMKNYRPGDMIGWFSNCPKLKHVEIDFSNIGSLSSENRSGRLGETFNGCILDKFSVLNLANTLIGSPQNVLVDRWIQIGIDSSLQYDEEIRAAISKIESRGWEPCVQYNSLSYSNDPSPENEEISEEMISKLELNDIHLPENYLRLLYLEHTNSKYPYIETNYIPSTNTGIKCIAKITRNKDCYPVGCCNTTDTDTKLYVPKLNYSNNNWELAYGGYKNFGNTGTGNKAKLFESALNFLNDGKAYIHVNKGTTMKRSLANSKFSFTPSSSLHIFGLNTNNGHINSLHHFGRIYRVQITEDEEIVRDYIPCLDASGVPCMYDIIQGKTYYNANTNGAQFTYGEIVSSN